MECTPPPPPPKKKNFDRVDEIHRFFMNPALCHAGSKIHKVLSTLSKVIGDWGGGHFTSVFYSVIYLCAMINFSLRNNLLSFSFVVIFYSMYSLHVIINGLMKEVVMCNKTWRLKSPLKVNRPTGVYYSTLILILPFLGGGGDNYLKSNF